MHADVFFPVRVTGERLQLNPQVHVFSGRVYAGRGGLLLYMELLAFQGALRFSYT